MFFFRKALETESLAEVQFVIDSFCLVSQSNNLAFSKKDCDWLILVCFIREHVNASAIFPRLENQAWLKILAKRVGKIMDSLS